MSMLSPPEPRGGSLENVQTRANSHIPKPMQYFEGTPQLHPDPTIWSQPATCRKGSWQCLDTSHPPHRIMSRWSIAISENKSARSENMLSVLHCYWQDQPGPTGQLPLYSLRFSLRFLLKSTMAHDSSLVQPGAPKPSEPHLKHVGVFQKKKNS